MSAEDEARTVDAHISYLAEGFFVNRRFVAPGAEVNTGSYETHPVVIRDGRPFSDKFTLDEHGFMLARHETAVRHFDDKEEIERVYPREVAGIVKRLTGADEVITRGWMIRTAGNLEKPQKTIKNYRHQGGIQPPAAEAHVDFTRETATAIAEETWREHFPDRQRYRRFISTSLWRTFSPPPQDWPLALCDARTVRPDEGAENTLVIVDEIPDETTMRGDLDESQARMNAYIFRHSPEHRWWYFSDMTRDEVILLKFYDSDESVAWRVPHTAFRDSTCPDAGVRKSIELRSFAYFL